MMTAVTSSFSGFRPIRHLASLAGLAVLAACLLASGQAQADDLPEELPVATDLNAAPTLSYLGAEKGYSYGMRVTFLVPREELFADFAGDSPGVLDPFYCVLERKDDSDWVEAVSTAFCQPLVPVAHANVTGLEPDTEHTFRVVLYQDKGNSNQDFIRKSLPSETITTRTYAPGTPNLRTTCRLSFGLDPMDGTVALSWQLATELTVESYELQRTNEPGGEFKTVATPAQEDSVTQAYRDEGLSTSDDYYYRVRARFQGGATSAWSSIVKDRATADREWCQGDRAAEDGAADAIGSEQWPETEDAQGDGNPQNGSGSGDIGGAGPGGNSNGDGDEATTGGGLASAGSSDDGARSEGCSCSLPGAVGTRGFLAWPMVLLGGLLLARRRRSLPPRHALWS